MRTQPEVFPPQPKIVGSWLHAAKPNLRASETKMRVLDYLFIFLLIGLSFARIYTTLDTMSATYDEPYHVACGIGYHQGIQLNDEQHPPLVRYIASWRLFAQGARLPEKYRWDIDELKILLGYGGIVENLRFARASLFSFFIIAVVSIFFWAKFLFGRIEAYLAALSYCLLPPVLAHASLVTTDHPATAMLCLAGWMLNRYVALPLSIPRSLAAGLTIGLAIATKLSALVFLLPSIAVLLAFLLLCQARQARSEGGSLALSRWREFLPGIVVLCGACIIAIVAGYGFEVRSIKESEVIMRHVGELQGKPYQPLFMSLSKISLPGGRFLWSVIHLVHHAGRGHLAYLMGDLRMYGWWYFFPVVLFMKVPLPFLILCVVGIFATLRNFLRTWSLVPMVPVSFVIGILGTCMLSTINLGVRHILPLMPALCILFAVGAVGLWKARDKTFVYPVISAALLVWLILNSWSAHPRYLSWFTELAPADPSLVLVDSDLDWGQGLIALSHELDSRGVKEVGINYFGVDMLENYFQGTVRRPPFGTADPGWFAVSLTPLRKRPDDFHWLKGRKWHLIADSIRLYEPETADR